MQYKLEMIRSSSNIVKDDLNQSYVYKVSLEGNFVMELSEEFSLFISTFIKGGMKKLAFDLSDLRYVDSAGIGIFINLTKLVRAAGGDLVLLNVNPKILDVLNLVKLNDFIQFFKSEKQVCEYLFSFKR